jgi:flagellar basal body-associated protein FliL
MRKELPIWLIVVVIVAAIVIVGAIFWRAARPLPEVRETPEMERQMQEAMGRAFREGGPAGGKIVPSPYAPKKSTQGQ